jgi:Kef-type K+ transport system membrane component KefB
LVLPFILLVSFKDRTIYPIILASLIGILTDATTGSNVPIFFSAYLLVTLIAKVFLSKFINYGELRANLINLLVGMAIILGVDLTTRSISLHGWTWIPVLLINVALTCLILVLYTWFGRRYFSWIESQTEERYR